MVVASTATRKYRNMKARLRTHGGVANPRHSYGYVCGLRFAVCGLPCARIHRFHFVPLLPGRSTSASFGDRPRPAFTSRRLPDLTPSIGQSVSFSFWAKGDVSDTGNMLYALRFPDGTGNILSRDGGNHFFQNYLHARTWSQISFTSGVVQVGAKAAFLEINTAVGPLLSARQNAVLIDDISLAVAAAPVPAPETYAMLLAGLGCIGAIMRQRRAR
jgi:hypothetical protein